MNRPRQIPGTGLFVRGTGFSSEQIEGFNRDMKRLRDWFDGKRQTPEEVKASHERCAAKERAFQEWDRTGRIPRNKR